MDPTYADPHSKIALAYLRKGDSQQYFVEEMRGFEGNGMKPAELAILKHAYATHAIHGFWQQLIAQEMAEPHPVPVSLATLYSNLGRRDEAVYWLQKACEQHSYELEFVREVPHFDDLRADPRIKDMLTRVGFPNN